MKIQRMFSNVEEEKLYSTGNEELDDLLERAFCEGYEYAQKEFNSKSQKKLREKLEVLKHLEESHKNTRLDEVAANKEIMNNPSTAKSVRKLQDLSDHIHDEIKKNPNRQKNGELLVEDGKVFLKKVSRSGAPGIKEYIESGGNKQREEKLKQTHVRNRGIKKVRGKKTPTPVEERNSPMMTSIRKAALSEKSKNELLKRKQMRENIKSSSTQKLGKQQATEGFIKKNWNKLGKGGKIAAITVPTVAVGTGIAIKKHKDKKKKEQE
jgi:hypothetical protein